MVVSLLATSVIAQSMQKWQTSNGTIYFGDHPPPGSTKAGTVEDWQSVAPIEEKPAPTPDTARTFREESAEGHRLTEERIRERERQRQREAQTEAAKQQELERDPERFLKCMSVNKPEDQARLCYHVAPEER